MAENQVGRGSAQPFAQAVDIENANGEAGFPAGTENSQPGIPDTLALMLDYPAGGLGRIYGLLKINLSFFPGVGFQITGISSVHTDDFRMTASLKTVLDVLRFEGPQDDIFFF